MWKINGCSIVFPSLDNNTQKYNNKIFAISEINYTYQSYKLSLGFDMESGFNLIDNADKKNPKIIAENSFDKLNIILEKFNLPKLNKYEQNIISDEFKIFMVENDEDRNNDYESNINSITRGDYGFPIKFTEELYIGDYEYTNDDKIKSNIKNIIIYNLNKCIQYNI